MSARIKTRVRTYKSHGSVWNEGELIAGYRKDHERPYTVLLCAQAREEREPAVMYDIEAPSWAAACSAIREAGFHKPPLTATQVRAGYRSK